MGNLKEGENAQLTTLEYVLMGGTQLKGEKTSGFNLGKGGANQRKKSEGKV